MAENVGSIYYTVDADTSKLVGSSKEADTALDKLQDEFKRTDKAANDSRFQMTKTASAVKELGREGQSTSTMMGKLSGVLAGLVTLRGVTGLIQMAEAYNEMAERIQLATSSQDEYNEVQTRLAATAAQTYRSLSEAQELYIRTAAGLKSLGYETDQVLDITDSLSFSFVKNATSVDRANAATSAFTKVINKGKVEADAWETIIAAVPTIIDDIATASGKTAAEIRNMGVSGQLSATQLTQGLVGSLESSRKAAEGMATTVRDAFTRLQTNLSVFVGEANRANGATNVLSSGILILADNIDTIVKVLTVAGAGALAGYIANLGRVAIQHLAGVVAAKAHAAQEVLLATAHERAAAAAAGQAAANIRLGGSQAAAATAANAHRAAQERLALAKTATARAGTGLLAVLGGPIGIIALAASAAAGFVLFGNNAQNAAGKMDQLAVSIDKVGKAQLELRRQQAAEGIIQLEKNAREAASSVQALEKDLTALSDGRYGNGVPTEGLDNVRKTLVEQKAAQEAANEELARGRDIQKQITDELERRAKAPSGGSGPTPQADPEVAKKLASMREELELSKLTGDARARLAAIQKLGANATAEERAEAEKLASAIYKLENGRKVGAAEQKKSAAELAQANKENKKTIDDLTQSLAESALKGEELALAKARASLNSFATPEDIANVERLASALWQVNQAEANKKLLGSVDPIANNNMEFETQIANLKALNEAKLLEDQRYLELKTQAEESYAERARQLDEERFRSQSATNELLMSSLDRLGQAGTEATVGLITGANNGQDAIRALAGAILNDAVGSLVQMGVQYVKNLIMGKAAATAATAFGIAQAGTLAAAWAPAAAMASLASFGANAAPAGAALASTTAIAQGLALAGGRRYGGAVAGGKMYRINENGAPEVFNAANGQQYMLPNRRGEVVSNEDASRGSIGSMPPNISINLIEDSSQAGQVRQSQDGDQTNIDMFVADIYGGGERSQAIERAYGLKRRGN